MTSALVANGEPPRLLALLDPDSDLADLLTETGLAVVSVLSWEDRDLSEAFGGTAPAPGGAFRQAEFVPTPWGPRLASATTWAGVRLESTAEVGWSILVTCVLEEVERRRRRPARAPAGSLPAASGGLTALGSPP